MTPSSGVREVRGRHNWLPSHITLLSLFRLHSQRRRADSQQFRRENVLFSLSVSSLHKKRENYFDVHCLVKSCIDFYFEKNEGFDDPHLSVEQQLVYIF